MMSNTSHRLPQKPIHIIHTGGTFGCAGQPLTPVPAPFFLPLLQEALEILGQGSCQVYAHLPLLDSTQIQPQDWLDLAHTLLEHAQTGQRHMVVIFGTDTMAYAAAWLAECFINSDLHIVLTGSQHPLLAPLTHHINPQSEALANLNTALQSVSVVPRGVFVSFDGQTWPAHTVQKIHTTNRTAFHGSSCDQPMTTYQTFQPQPWQHITQQRLIQYALAPIPPRIVVYQAIPMNHGQLALQLQALCTPVPDALILLGYGTGNFPEHPLIREQLQTLISHGTIIIISTSVPFGGTTQDYATGDWLPTLGVLPSADLTLPAIYTRLLWICALQSCPIIRRQQWLERLDEQVLSHQH